MADDFDVDLHPIRMMNATVSQFELDSLYEAHAKTCVQLSASKSDCEVLRVNNEELQASLQEARTELMLNSTLLDYEKAQVSNLTQQLAQQAFVNCFLQHTLTSVRRGEMTEAATQTLPNSVNVVSEPTQSIIDISEPHDGATEIENELREKLIQLEALYDMVLRENKSMKRQMTKLTSKLRILNNEDKVIDGSLGTTIRKQGRFMVHKRLECAQCYQRFSSHEEMEQSNCHYHPMPAVPQDGADGREYYYLCCSGLAKNRGQAGGCCTGKHHANMESKCEE